MGGGEGAAQGLNFFSSAYSFPDVWGNIGFWGGMFITFLSILVIITVTNEFSFKTHRQNVMDGWSRLNFYHAKVAGIVVLSLMGALYVFILGILFGWSNSGSLANAFAGIESVFYFFLLSLNYLGFAMLMAIFIRRSGLAIGLFILYAYVVENMAGGIINFATDSHIGDYLPLQASDELLPFQIMKMMKQMMAMGETSSSVSFVLMSVCWCAVYYIVGRFILLRRDW